MKPKIGITIGDSNGIGAEVILKSLSELDFNQSTPIIIGKSSVIDYYAEKLNIPIPYNTILDISEAKSNSISILDAHPSDNFTPNPGKISAESGKYAMWAIETAIELCKNNKVDGMVTAPISKEAVNLAGFNIPGHTEFLAEKTNTDQVLMTLVSDTLRVALVSGHIPVYKIAENITQTAIIDTLILLNRSLKEDFGIKSPKIAVLGLNPHAGDGGVLGKEEQNIIGPAIALASKNNVYCEGPFPTDGFFGQQLYKNYDAILAMYHDQGLAPFKLLSFGKGVNFTAGLPIIRTSPDHGTAFNIAGKGIANASSFNEAYQLAVTLATHKK